MSTVCQQRTYYWYVLKVQLSTVECTDDTKCPTVKSQEHFCKKAIFPQEFKENIKSWQMYVHKSPETHISYIPSSKCSTVQCKVTKSHFWETVNYSSHVFVRIFLLIADNVFKLKT